MYAASAALGLLAITLAWPVPLSLSAAEWPSRAPGLALALWQAIALGGGLAMIGALLSFGFAPFDESVGGISALSDALLRGPIPPAFGVLHIVALGGAALLSVHLVLNLVSTAARTERSRRQHRAAVELLSAPMPEQPGTRVLDHPTPIAYCVPGVHTVTVLSGGLIELLKPEELGAVIAHERTHLRQFHHLVLLAFRAWHSALPWFPIANRAENAVGQLVEMLADDDAAKEVPRPVLARAIALVGTAQPSPSGELRAAPSSVSKPSGMNTDAARSPLTQRVTRLLAPEPTLPRAARVFVIATCVALVLLPLGMLFSVASHVALTLS